MGVSLPHVFERNALADAFAFDNTRIPFVLKDEFFLGCGGFGFSAELDDGFLENLLQFTASCVNKLFPLLDLCKLLRSCA
jgi:hypothetical protein